MLQNELAITILKDAPVTEGHSLIIPRRHIETYFQLTHPEISLMNQLIFKQREYLSGEFKVNDFNIRIDDGVIAGQIIPHTHIHLIPRR